MTNYTPEQREWFKKHPLVWEIVQAFNGTVSKARYTGVIPFQIPDRKGKKYTDG